MPRDSLSIPDPRPPLGAAPLVPGPQPVSVAHASFQTWLLNLGLGVGVAFLWLIRGFGDHGLWIQVYLLLGLVAAVALLALVPGALMLAVHQWLVRTGRWRWIGLWQAGIGAMFLALLYTDTIVFRLLGYHLNGAFLNVIATEGSGDAIVLGPYVWLTATTVIVLLTLGQTWFWHWRVRRIDEREREGRLQPIPLRPRVMSCLVLLPTICWVEATWSFADLSGDHQLIHAAAPVPGIRARLATGKEGLLGIDLRPEGALFAWPRSRPELPADGPRPNLMVCVLDSWRADAFTPELTPHLTAFAEGARVFSDHLSSGNQTRFGLFGMLYGLHGSYWNRALALQAPAVMVETLQEAGYDVRVISAASMNFPEMRLTAWSSLEDASITDRFQWPDGRPMKRADHKDVRVAETFEAWMAERAATDDRRPFFAFVLLDSPHQPYFNPGGPYQPALDSLNYIEMGRVLEGPQLADMQLKVENTYRNSVLHADEVAGRMLRALETHDQLDQTVVCVTGDHGEEFFEHGFWGHTSNFTPEQVRVPFYLKGPGIEPGLEQRPTSHLDLSGSLLELLGADPAQRSGYTLGESLFAPPVARDRVIGGFYHLGVWTDLGIFNLPLEPEGDVLGVYDESWNLHADVRGRLERARPRLQVIADQCHQFLDHE